LLNASACAHLWQLDARVPAARSQPSLLTFAAKGNTKTMVVPANMGISPLINTSPAQHK